MNIGQSQNNHTDFELNLASIIDCFTVIIAFLLASTAFVSIGILDAGIAATKPSSSPSEKVEILTVLIHQDLKLSLSLSDSQHSASRWTAEANSLSDLQPLLNQLKQAHPDLQSALVKADDSVAYANVIDAMESTRKLVPNVLMGGF